MNRSERHNRTQICRKCAAAAGVALLYMRGWIWFDQNDVSPLSVIIKVRRMEAIESKPYISYNVRNVS